jgi:hypothetical protein
VIDQNGKLTKENDLSLAKFDVAVNVGPSSISKREATVRAITNLLPVTQDPETQAVLSNTILQNMEGEGIQELREWSRGKLVKAGVLKPTEEEQKALAAAAQNAQPSPNDQYLKAMAAEAQAKAQHIQSESGLVAAKIDKTKAETLNTLSGVQLAHKAAHLKAIETLAGVDLDHRRATIDAAESLHNIMQPPSGQPDPSGGLGSANNGQ